MKTKVCKKCGEIFDLVVFIDGKRKSLHRRKYCLKCSPFGGRNNRKLEKLNDKGQHSCIDCGKPVDRRQRCSYCSVKRSQDKKMGQLQEVVGNRCIRCGYGGEKKSPLINLHHIHLFEKEFCVNGNSTGSSWAKLIPELLKCIPLCCRCHQEYHLTNIISNQEIEILYRRFWKHRHPIAMALAEPSPIPKRRLKKKRCEHCDEYFHPVRKTKIYCSPECAQKGRRKIAERRCKKCGDTFRPRASRVKCCSPKCAQELQRKCKRPSPEQLQKDVVSMPMTKVGEKYGVSDNAVRKWLKNYERKSG